MKYPPPPIPLPPPVQLVRVRCIACQAILRVKDPYARLTSHPANPAFPDGARCSGVYGVLAPPAPPGRLPL